MGESRDSYLRRAHGMTDEEYETKLICQGGVCEVCGRTNPAKGEQEPERLGVDHSHYSGMNRGLLCHRCNKILGFLQDSQELLQRLLEYLRRYDRSQIPGVEGSEIRTALQLIRTAESLDALPADSVH